MSLFQPNISKMLNKKDIKGLEKAVTSKEWKIAVEAIKALGDLQSIQSSNLLIQILASNIDSAVGHTAAEVLAKLQVKEAIPIFKEGLKHRFAKNHCLNALAQFQDISTIDIFAEALIDRMNPEGRLLAAKVLFQLGDPGIQSLVSSLESDYNPFNEISKTIKDFLKDSKHITDIQNFFMLAFQRNNDDLKEKASKILSEVSNQILIKQIEIGLNDSNYHVQYCSLSALSKIDSSVIINKILPFLEMDDVIGDNAMSSIIKSGSKAKNIIENTLSNNNPFLLKRSAKILMNIGDEDSVDRLISVFNNNNNEEVLEAIVIAIQELTNKNDKRYLKRLLEISDKQPNFVKYLEKISFDVDTEEENVESLINSLSSSKIELQMFVSKTLGNIKSDLAKNSLVKILDNSNKDLSSIAALSLAQMLDKKSIPNIRNLYNNWLNTSEPPHTDGYITYQEMDFKDRGNRLAIALSLLNDIESIPLLIKGTQDLKRAYDKQLESMYNLVKNNIDIIKLEDLKILSTLKDHKKTYQEYIGNDVETRTVIYDFSKIRNEALNKLNT